MSSSVVQAAPVPGLSDADLQKFAADFAAAIQVKKGFTSSTPAAPDPKAWWNDILNVVTQIGPPLIDALAGGGQKAFMTASPSDQKAFWGDVENMIGSTLPILLQTAFGDGASKGLDTGSTRDKAWWNDVFSVVGQLGPSIISAVTQQKDFDGVNEQDKNFLDDIVHTVTTILPTVLPFVLAAV